MNLSIYLAGFDVFYPNAIEHGEHLKAVCGRYGFRGLFPKDNVIDRSPGRSKDRIAADIFRQNIEQIDRSDIIVANLNCFRGAEPDSGTSFELGYGYAKGKRLYGYVDGEQKLWEKVESEFGGVGRSPDGRMVDKLGYHVENFDFPVNLMLSVPAVIVAGSFEHCIRRVREDLGSALDISPCKSS